MHKKLIKFIEQNLGRIREPVEFTLIGTGANYDVYSFYVDSKAYALRIQERLTHDFSKVERFALKELNGFYAPKLYCFNGGDLIDKSFMIEDLIEGKHYDPLSNNQMETLIESISAVHKKTSTKPEHETIGKYLWKIYEEKFGKGFSYLEKSALVKSGDMDPKVILDFNEQLKTVIKSIEDNSVEYECLIHGDLNPKNLLWNHDKVVFIDWELSRFATPSIEFGGILYCHGKTEAEFSGIMDLLPAGIRDEVRCCFQLKLLDSLAWRIQYLHSVDLSKKDYDAHVGGLKRDLAQIGY